MSLKSPERSPKPLRPDLVTSSIASRSQVARRRSTRMALKTRVGLSGEDRQKCAFTITANATNLNRHGAAVQLSRELLIGSTVVLRNQRGIQLSARVVAQLSSQNGVPVYGVEFVEQDENAKAFWGITFPSTPN